MKERCIGNKYQGGITMENRFRVGDVVMFFVRDGKISEPPGLDEISDEELQSAPCGTIVSNCDGCITVRMEDDGRFSTFNENEADKIWSLNGPSRVARQKKPGNSVIFSGSPLPIDPELVTNIHPIADA